MPVGGLIITVRPEDRKPAQALLCAYPELTLYGSDEKGNIIAVLDTVSTGAMENLIQQINLLEPVLSVTLSYINVEDEITRFHG